MNTSTLLLALITGWHQGKVSFSSASACPPNHPSPTPTPFCVLLQQGRTTSEFSLWPKDTNNREGLDCNPVFTFICHTFKGEGLSSMQFLKDVLHGKMRRITVNNAVGWGLQVLNDKKTVSLTTDLDLVYTE